MVHNVNLSKKDRNKAKHPMDFFGGNEKTQRRVMSDMEIMMEMGRASAARKGRHIG